jgi:hypothetical protein
MPAVQEDGTALFGLAGDSKLSDAHPAQQIVCFGQDTHHVGRMGDLAGSQIRDQPPASHGLLERLLAVIVVQRAAHQGQTGIEQLPGARGLAVQRLERALGAGHHLAHAALGSRGTAERHVLDGLTRFAGEHVQVGGAGGERGSGAGGEAIARIVQRHHLHPPGRQGRIERIRRALGALEIGHPQRHHDGLTHGLRDGAARQKHADDQRENNQQSRPGARLRARATQRAMYRLGKHDGGG